MYRNSLTLRLPVGVVAVSDGDTVRVTIRGGGGNLPFKVRLHGIDAPELDQEFGVDSRDQLAAMPAGKSVFVDVLCVDRYGRQVGILHEGNPRQSFNKQMIEGGMAYNFPSYGMLFGGNNAQVRARKKRVGIWARFGGDVRPWSFRHGGTETPIEFVKAKTEAEAKAKSQPTEVST